MPIYYGVTISDKAKFRTQSFTLLSIGCRVGRAVTFDKKVVNFAEKFEICYIFCVVNDRNCVLLPQVKVFNKKKVNTFPATICAPRDVENPL